MSGELFLSMTIVGLGAVALWLHVRFPSRRPASLIRAAVHVGFSFITVGLLPDALSLVLAHFSPSQLRMCLELVLVIPVLTYWLLSFIWLLARILDLLGGPRGGHPVRHGAS